jgi:FKBP-type peptidyl-prolyl cis-trans isomerase FkpA
MKIVKQIGYLLALCLVYTSCTDRSDQGPEAELDVKKLKDTLVKVNRLYATREEDEIKQYVEHRGWNMKLTERGVRYYIYERGKGRRKAQVGNVALVKYKIQLLDGTVCYTSEKDGPKHFVIEQDNVESGLHEGIQEMCIGDKAVFVVPSVLAHGFTGDGNKIPSKATIIYYIELLDLKY